MLPAARALCGQSRCNTRNINKVDWNKLSQELKYEYSEKTKQLEKISLPRDAIQCHDPVCSNASHKSEIKDFYDAIIEEIRLIFDVQLYYTKMIESLSESGTDDK